MSKPEWDGFGIRLGRAIDKWSGGGQRPFVRALKRYAKEQRLQIATSHRTLVNYLNGSTRPNEVWVRAAAAVLRWNPEHLLYGGDAPERVGERPATSESSGISLNVGGDATERTSLLVHYITHLEELIDLPMHARMMLFYFFADYFQDDLDGWGSEHRARRQGQVRALLEEFFGPLLTRSSMDTYATMALTASLVSAAYVRAGVEPYEPTTSTEKGDS